MRAARLALPHTVAVHDAIHPHVHPLRARLGGLWHARGRPVVVVVHRDRDGCPPARLPVSKVRPTALAGTFKLRSGKCAGATCWWRRRWGARAAGCSLPVPRALAVARLPWLRSTVPRALRRRQLVTWPPPCVAELVQRAEERFPKRGTGRRIKKECTCHTAGLGISYDVTPGKRRDPRGDSVASRILTIHQKYRKAGTWYSSSRMSRNAYSQH